MISNYKYAEKLITDTLLTHTCKELNKAMGYSGDIASNVRRRIYKGGYIPRLSTIEKYAEFNGMSIADAFVNPSIKPNRDLRNYNIKYLGRNLKRLRKKIGISTNDLTLDVGVNSGTIYQIESGRCLCNPILLQDIADYTGIEIIDFFKPIEGSDASETKKA